MKKGMVIKVNKSIVLHIIGWILNFEAGFMVLPLIVAIIYGEESGYSFLITIGICLAIGLPLALIKPKSRVFFAREGLVSVGLGWIALSVMGALPFYITQEIPSFVDALFEVISGFTTTGSSILVEIEALSYCMLFWRSFTHWIGGMGVLVFILAILPMTGGETMHFMRAESPGPSVGKLVPKIRNTALLLYIIYLVMTIVEIVLLLIGGMPLFDSLTVAFGTAGTGGFAIKSSSIASYSTYSQNIITLFMILFGVNFSVYYLLLLKKFKAAIMFEELRWYLIAITSAIILISFNTGGIRGFFGAIHHAAFQVGSIITTTGYATLDFNHWPTFSKVVLVILMFIGACSGSTGGGIKVSRIAILFKTVVKEISYMLHKRSIKVIKFDGKKIEHETLRSINVYFYCYILIFTISVLIVSADNFDFTTSFTAIAATINNIGPGLDIVGPYGSFVDFSIVSKFVMMFDMLIGRLEIFPILLLFTPGTWKK